MTVLEAHAEMIIAKEQKYFHVVISVSINPILSYDGHHKYSQGKQ